jgi:LysM repeat protein
MSLKPRAIERPTAGGAAVVYRSGDAALFRALCRSSRKRWFAPAGKRVDFSAPPEAESEDAAIPAGPVPDTRVRFRSSAPLIPKGCFLEQTNRRRLRFKTAVFLVLAVHVAVVLLLLRQAHHAPPPSQAYGTALIPFEAAPDFNVAREVLSPQAVAATAVMAPARTPGTQPKPAAAVSAAPKAPADFPAAPALSSQPPPQKNAVAARWHRVASGDTCARISRKLGIPLESLLAANPGIQPHRLRTGQYIRIP